MDRKCNATHESSTSRNELERLWNAVKHVAGWQWDYEAVPFDEVMSRPRYSHLKCALEAAAAQLFIQSESGAPRWVPVAASIARTRVNEVTIGLPIFGHDQEGQWYRLDGNIEEPK